MTQDARSATAANPPVSRSVFVTGAYGMLGFWLVEALLARGDRVVVLRRDSIARSALILTGLEQHVAVVHGDLVDPGIVERAVGDYAIDTIFHLAGQSILGTAARSPLSTFESNVRGTWTVLEAARTHAVSRVVVASSYKAYGAPLHLPYTEQHPLAAVAPYGVSKACADLLARSYWPAFGVPVAVTRFANVYGGGDLNPSRLIPEATAAALAGRAPVIRSDGSPERDFLYVEDAVTAYLALAEALGGGDARGEAFNAGGGASHSVRSVVELVCRAAGTEVAPDVRGAPRGAPDCERVDAAKLRALTGWAPAVGLEEGIRRTVEWYRAHPAALAG